MSGVILLAFLLTALCRGQAVSYPFLWDDEYVLEQSGHLRGQGFGGVLRLFDPEHWLREGGPSHRPFRPVRDLGFLLAHHLSGGRPSAYHVTNLALHALNAALVLWFAWLLLANVYAAGAAALVFVVHPVQTEAVAWAKNSAEMLALCFGLLCACLFLHWLRGPATRKRAMLLVGATGAFVLALLSKESALCVPVVLLLWCVMLPRKGGRVRGVVAVAPMLAVVIVYAGVTFGAVTVGGQKAFAVKTGELPLAGRAELVGRTLAVYGRALFVPSLPAPWRALEVPRQPNAVLAGVSVLAALTLLAHFVLMVWRGWRLHIGLWWMLIALGPASNLLAYNERRPLADQRAYAPSLGVALLIGAVCAVLFQRRKHAAAAVWVLAGLMAASLGVLSYRSTPVWRHRLALWRQAVRQAPRQGNANYNLGVTYGMVGYNTGAAAQYKHGLACQKTPAVEACLNLGSSLSKLGRLKEAKRYYERAVELEPTNEWAHIGFGGVCADLGDYQRGEAHAKRALELRRYWPNAANNIGAFYQRRGRLDEALRWYRTAKLYNQRHADTEANIARLWYDKGDAGKALSHFSQALRFASPPQKISFHKEMGSIHAEQGRSHLAVPHIRAAIDLGDPEWETRVMLGDAYADMGAFDEAGPCHLEALRLNPGAYDVGFRLVRDHVKLGNLSIARSGATELMRKAPEFPLSHTAMGLVYEAAGRKGEALRAYAAALRRAPDEAEALKGIGRIHAANPASRDQGIRSLRRACALRANDAEAKIALAEALDAAGERSKAMDVWREVLRLRPKHPRALERIGKAQPE